MDSQPFLLRDFRQGRISKSAISESLVPINSLSNSLNVNFDSVIGKAVVRPGTTLLGSQVAANKTPLGLFEFVTANSAINDMLAVFSGASTASVYYFDTTWHTSGYTTLDNSAKNRFAELGGYAFIVNGVQAMKSSADGNTWGTVNCITTNSVVPSLIFATKSRLLASGDTTSGAGHSRSRVYFSSIVDPSTSPPTITWSTDPSTGNWIDINPDDGSDVTGFSQASTLTLVFKSKSMYRLNAITTTVDTDNIFNIGAVSQESIVNCLGTTYFFSGQDIRRTQGDFPEQISRLGVQDYIDAIPQSSWANVCAGTDGFNVYFSIGNITLNTNQDTQVSYSNVVLKFSTRDGSWSVHAQGQQHRFYAQFTTSAGRTMIEADTSGNIQTMNSGTTDNSTAINYNLETQDLEFGNRAHTKKISDKIAVFTQNGQDGNIAIKSNGGDFVPIIINLSNRIAKGRDLNFEGEYFSIRWFGQCTGNPPILEGFYLESVTDQGFI